VLVEFFDAVEVDDGGAVRAPEGLRVELFFKLLHAEAQQVRAAADVELDVVVVGLDPVNVRGVDEDDPAAGLHHEAREVAALSGGRRSRRLFFSARVAAQEGAKALGQSPRLFHLDVRLGARERLPEPVVVERLQEVVERVHLERLERVGVVGGDEDDGTSGSSASKFLIVRRAKGSSSTMSVRIFFPSPLIPFGLRRALRGRG
jgi:hypothetical protein